MLCFGEDTGEKRHYRSRRIQEDHGQGMEPVSSDTAWFSPLLMIRFFWRLLDSLHSFLLLSIQQRFIEHLLCTRHFHTRHLRRSNGNHCNHVMETCLPTCNWHICAQHAAPKKTRDECIYWVSSHCPSSHQIPFTKSGSSCVLNVHNLLCSVLVLKIA